MSAASWWLLAAAVVLAAAGYRYSLWRHPVRRCHYCGGAGRHQGAVWSYAAGPCRAWTFLPPRVQCDGGRIPRWGLRLLKLGKK